MPRFKNWEPGKARIKVEIITPDGGNMEWELPNRTAVEGLAVAALLNTMTGQHSPPVIDTIIKDLELEDTAKEMEDEHG